MSRDIPPVFALIAILLSGLLAGIGLRAQATTCTSLAGHLTSHTFIDTLGLPFVRPVLRDETVFIPYDATGIVCFDGGKAGDRRCVAMGTLRMLTFQ